MSFGKNYRALRKKKGLKIEDLVVQTGINKNTISRIEREEQEPQPSTKTVLAQALGLKPEDIEDLNPKKSLEKEDLFKGITKMYGAGEVSDAELLELFVEAKRQRDEQMKEREKKKGQ